MTTRKEAHIRAVQGFIKEVDKTLLDTNIWSKKHHLDQLTLSDMFRKGQEATGITEATIRTIYYGFAVPSLKTALKLSKWLGVSVNNLFSDEEDDSDVKIKSTKET